MQGRMADENRRPVAAAAGKPLPSVREMGNQRALRDINKLVGAHPYPCAIAKKPVLQMYAASLVSKQHPKHQAIETDASPGVEHHKEASIDDGTVDVDVELCETIDDTDKADSKDPLAATEYVEELYNFYRETEEASCVKPDYMTSQEDINYKMRAILIDWLIEVHYKFELMDETLFLTVNIIDRFLENRWFQGRSCSWLG
ncbi:hypothetical protein EJB05_28166, partial [Eragrostis curvula]